MLADSWLRALFPCFALKRTIVHPHQEAGRYSPFLLDVAHSLVIWYSYIPNALRRAQFISRNIRKNDQSPYHLAPTAGEILYIGRRKELSIQYSYTVVKMIPPLNSLLYRVVCELEMYRCLINIGMANIAL